MFEITKDEGVIINVGAHTGLYTITSLKANPKNSVVCFEPYFMNLSRLITNLRLNGLSKNVSTILGAVSNFDGKSNLKITTEKSYMSKGGKLGEEGQDTNVYKLDTDLHFCANIPLYEKRPEGAFSLYFRLFS